MCRLRGRGGCGILTVAKGGFFMGETPGVYIHIPFCASRCDYCDFYTVTRRGDLFEPYTEAVCRAVATAPLEAGREVGSVYFGGGTPALLGPKRLGKMLAAVAKRWVVAPDAEITLEANPGAVTGAGLRGFREAGFNRLSLGVQSGVDGRLRDLGRIHTAGGAAETVRLAREAGFENLTLDLMLGLPGQGVEEGLFPPNSSSGLRRSTSPAICSSSRRAPGMPPATGRRSWTRRASGRCI